MSGTLDEVYERLRVTGPEFEGYLSNHAPMAADALLRLHPDADVHAWLDRYVDRLDDAPSPRGTLDPARWREALGDSGRLGDWVALFDRALAEVPWTEVLATWWPRLLPGSVASATHCLIRTGHAVRSLREEETAPRRAELAAALGYWAARWLPVPGAVPPAGDRAPGQALDGVPVLASAGGGVADRLALLSSRPDWSPALASAAPLDAGDVPAALDALTDAAVVRYCRWAGGSPVMLVHMATAPRAAGLVLPSLPRELWPATARAAWTASAAIAAAYRPVVDLPDPPRDVTAGQVAEAAVAHGDEHVLKFVEVALEAAARGAAQATGAGLRAVQLIDGAQTCATTR